MQIEDIDSLLDSDIDYLILIPSARNGYDQVLLEARQEGVPVILAEQDVEMEPEYDREDYILGYVASDYYAEESCVRTSFARHFGIESPAIPWLYRGKVLGHGLGAVHGIHARRKGSTPTYMFQACGAAETGSRPRR